MWVRSKLLASAGRRPGSRRHSTVERTREEKENHWAYQLPGTDMVVEKSKSEKHNNRAWHKKLSVPRKVEQQSRFSDWTSRLRRIV
jgi:hypothetical protein